MANRYSHKLTIAAIAALTAAVAAAAAAPRAAYAQGTPLAPGQTITPGFGPSAGTDYGTMLTSMSDAITLGSGDTLFSVSAQSAVYRNTQGTLDFYYQVSNLSGSQSEVTRFAAGDFGDTITSVFFRAEPGAPFQSGDIVATNIDRSGSGRIIGFNFEQANNQGVLRPGENSFTAVVRTSATDFQTGRLGVIGGYAASVNSYAPRLATGGSGNPIPEPGTLALVAPALLGVAGAVARRRRRA